VKREYHRHLPHQIPEGSPIFVTWNLKGSMSTEVLNALRRERERLEREPARPGESWSDRKIREGKHLFATADKHLDSTVAGPMHLKNDRVASIVHDSLKFGVPERYELFAWCVMANHVHVLLKPVIDLSKIMQGIKGFTAYRINTLPSVRGRVLWQDESYDHWARDEEELFRIVHYIEYNPVEAGLCKRPEEWRWSSARLRDRWPVSQRFQADKHWRDAP
jgi:putative transposase